MKSKRSIFRRPSWAERGARRVVPVLAPFLDLREALLSSCCAPG
jgi:acyl-CoA hydrolase